MTKVSNIQTINNNNVAESQLILITHEKIITQQDFHEWKLVMLDKPYYIEHNMVGETDKIIKPILISKTEDIEVGDIVKIPCAIGIVKEITHKGIICEDLISLSNRYGQNGELQINSFHKKDVTKILALPKHFSTKHLQDIVDGILNDGDTVYIECDARTDFIDTHDACEGPAYQIKLINNYISLIPIKKEKRLYTKEEVIEIAQSVALRFGGSELQDYVSKKEVGEYINKLLNVNTVSKKQETWDNIWEEYLKENPSFDNSKITLIDWLKQTRNPPSEINLHI